MALSFETTIKNCLYVNWALDVERLPPLPPPLRYEKHQGESGEVSLLTATFFRQGGLRFRFLPFPRFSYPQLSIRFYVLDGEGIPAVWYYRLLTPPWTVPLSRLAGIHTTRAAILQFPSRNVLGGDDGLWCARRVSSLALKGSLGAHVRVRPDLGSFEATTSYFLRRTRGYSGENGAVRRLDISAPTSGLNPWKIEIYKDDLLAGWFPSPNRTPWPEVHSAWYCSDRPLIMSLVKDDLKARRKRTSAVGCEG